MSSRLIAFSAFLLSACTLTEDGEIASTCDELGTCDALEEGGFIYVENNTDSSSPTANWRVVLTNGYGEILKEWPGQGTPGPVVYDASTETVYLAVNDTIRILRDSIPPAINGFAGMNDAIPMEGGMLFSYEDGVAQVFGEGANDDRNFSDGVLKVARPINPEKYDAAMLDESQSNNQLALLHVSTDQTPWSFEVEELEGVSKNRVHDIFAAGDEFQSCSETGATFKIKNLLEGETTPDRYPVASNFEDIVSCEYRNETDEVVLFSKTEGVALMNKDSDIHFIIAAPSDGYQIGHGSVW